MFDKRKETGAAEEAPGPAPRRTEPLQESSLGVRNTAVIGSTITIKGQVRGEENLVIEGGVEGSVELPGHDLTIGPKGRVEAALTAKTVKVDGQVTGDITGSEKVIITKSGRVLGNIVAPRVTLEDGAKFKGSIDMDPAGGQAERPPASVKPVGAVEKTSAGSKQARSGS